MNFSKCITCILLQCILLSYDAFSQAYWENYELFNTRSGLPNNAILSITQDDRNLLWIGTRNGLCIYDGYSFEIKKDLFDAKDGEWRNVFCSLFKDAQGNIWMSTQNGRVAMYDPKLDKITPITTIDLKSNEYITAFFQDKLGILWMGSNDGSIFSLQQKSVKILKQTTIGQHILSIENGEKGTFIINGYYSLKLSSAINDIKPEGDSIAYITLCNRGKINFYKGNNEVIINENEILNRHNYVRCLTKSGKLLIATSHLIKVFDANGNLLDRIVVSDDPNYNNEEIANFIFEDAAGILWMGTNFGLIKIDRSKYCFTKFATNSLYRKLNSNYVRSVFIDRNKNIWVGYKAGYVNRLAFDSIKQKFKSITCHYEDKSKSVSAINIIKQLRSGTILLGGAESLFYTTLKESVTASPVIHNYVLKDSNNNNLALTEVWSIHEDRAGKLWVGTRAMGLFIINPVTHKYRHYPYNLKTLALMSVWQIFEDSKGSIWLATENGLDSVVFSKDGFPEKFYNLHRIYKGEVGKQVWSVTEGSDHHLWITTTDNGISMVDKGKKTFTTYNRDSGLQSNVTCGILNDLKGNLWISTMNGISRFDLTNHSFQHFTENDGLVGNDYNFNACCRASSGQLFFGSKSGLVAFYPDETVYKKTFSTPVLIRSVNLWNKEYFRSPSLGKPIILEHNQNSFSFRLALPHYSIPSTHEYQYMLEGFDDTWITTDAKHPLAVYTKIPPGKYLFKVIGLLDGQRLGSKPTTLNVIVRPAIWQQPLFIALMVLLAVIGLVFFVYWRFKKSVAKERDKSIAEQKFAELELRALQAQMNPHFIFNSINAIQHFMLTNDEKVANDYLSQFARLMRLYFESSNNKYIVLTEEIELLRLYVNLEKLRFDDKFDYTFSVDPYLENTSFEIPSMLLQPYVENAINHGLALRKTKGLLHISFVCRQGEVLCTIDDNGVGRKSMREKSAQNGKQKLHSSDAIYERLNAYRQADNLNVRVVIVDKVDDLDNSTGTKVEIHIPELT